MRSLRSRPADDRTAALARARVAQLTSAARPAHGGDGIGAGWVAVSPVETDGASTPADAADGPWREPGRRRYAASRSRSRVELASIERADLSEPAPWDAAELAGQPATGADGEGDAARSPEWLDALKDRMPLAVRPRMGLERTHLAVIVLVVLVGLIGATVLFLLARPEVVPIESEVVATGTPVATGSPPPPEPGTPSTPGPPDPATPSTAAAIVVHVAGLVARPGIVELPAGSRVVEAIEAAGGATPEADLTPINLARVLTDGEQVLVTADPPRQAAPPAAPPGSGATASTPAVPINLNTATAAELETLPGIGPALAGRILAWRDQNGHFTTVDELREVAGIGEQRFAQLEPLVTV